MICIRVDAAIRGGHRAASEARKALEWQSRAGRFVAKLEAFGRVTTRYLRELGFYYL